MKHARDSRKDRLAKALRENLKRRKARARALGAEHADGRNSPSANDDAPGRNPAAKSH